MFLTIKRRNQAVYSMCACDDPSIRAGKNEELSYGSLRRRGA